MVRSLPLPKILLLIVCRKSLSLVIDAPSSKERARKPVRVSSASAMLLKTRPPILTQSCAAVLFGRCSSSPVLPKIKLPPSRSKFGAPGSQFASLVQRSVAPPPFQVKSCWAYVAAVNRRVSPPPIAAIEAPVIFSLIRSLIIAPGFLPYLRYSPGREPDREATRQSPVFPRPGTPRWTRLPALPGWDLD